MQRRSFLSWTAVPVVGTAASATTAGATDRFPQVSTRDHFGINWAVQTELQDGVGPTEYGTNGTIPGYHTDEAPAELVVFVHGWLQSEADVRNRFPKQRAALRTAGADGTIVSYSWDSDSTKAGWWVASEIARRNGPKLAAFLRDFATRTPETTIRVVGSSMGGRLVPSALAALHDRHPDVVVDSVSLLGAAVPTEKVAIDGAYGPGLDQNAATIDNFWKSDDTVLNRNFTIAELTDALGSNGLDPAVQPSGYSDHRVDHVQSHHTYWKLDGGCIEAVVDAWE